MVFAQVTAEKRHVFPGQKVALDRIRLTGGLTSPNPSNQGVWPCYTTSGDLPARAWSVCSRHMAEYPARPRPQSAMLHGCSERKTVRSLWPR